MNTSLEKLRRMLYWSSFIIALLSVVSFFVLGIMQAHIRYTLNQNFSYLGGFGLEALAFLGLGLLVGLMFALRPSSST